MASLDLEARRYDWTTGRLYLIGFNVSSSGSDEEIEELREEIKGFGSMRDKIPEKLIEQPSTKHGHPDPESPPSSSSIEYIAYRDFIPKWCEQQVEQKSTRKSKSPSPRLQSPWSPVGVIKKMAKLFSKSESKEAESESAAPYSLLVKNPCCAVPKPWQEVVPHEVSAVVRKYQFNCFFVGG